MGKFRRTLAKAWMTLRSLGCCGGTTTSDCHQDHDRFDQCAETYDGYEVFYLWPELRTPADSVVAEDAEYSLVAEESCTSFYSFSDSDSGIFYDCYSSIPKRVTFNPEVEVISVENLADLVRTKKKKKPRGADRWLIRELLDLYKATEMEVHEESRIYTRFYHLPEDQRMEYLRTGPAPRH